MGKKAFLFTLLFFTTLCDSAQAAGLYYYDNIDVDIKVNEDSTFDVAEKQTYFLDGNFGYFNRGIELKDLDRITDVEVLDSEGNRVANPDISYKGNGLRVQWNFLRRDFDQEMKSWTVKYKVHGGLGFYKNHDEIYWNALFPNRDVIIKKAAISVTLPEEIENNLQAKMFVGTKGSSKQSYDYEMKNNSVVFYGYNIRPGEFLTIVAWWPKGVIQKPFLYQNQAIALIVTIISLLIPLFVLIYSFSLWNKKGKDAKINKTIIAQYTPPKTVSFSLVQPHNEPSYLAPAITNVLVKQRIDAKDILATIVDLAVRGYLKIIEEEKGFSVFKHKEYIFEKRRDKEGLNPFEIEILSSLFKEKDRVLLSELKDTFYKSNFKIHKEIYKEMAKTDFFDGNIRDTRKKYAFVWIIIISISVACLILGSFLLTSFSPIAWVSLVIFSVSLLTSSAIGLIFSYFMPALTKEGAEAKWQALGFKEYLQTAEKFRIEAETVETFSKFISYAIAFGVEKQWIERFSYFPYQQQNWYYPAAIYSGNARMPNSFGELSSSFSSFSKSVYSAFSSSSGGGGAGGGSAGGGGGGGSGGAG